MSLIMLLYTLDLDLDLHCGHIALTTLNCPVTTFLVMKGTISKLIGDSSESTASLVVV